MRSRECSNWLYVCQTPGSSRPEGGFPPWSSYLLDINVDMLTSEQGLMLTNGRAFLLRAPWAIVFPGVAILLTTLAFNLVVDGVRDALDPSLRG